MIHKLISTKKPGLILSILFIFTASRLCASTVFTSNASIVYFYNPGCGSCEAFLSEMIPDLERKTGLVIDVEVKDISDPTIFEEYQILEGKHGSKSIEFPALLVKGVLLHGDKEISTMLEEILRGYNIPNISDNITSKTNAADFTRKATFFSILIAGLADGINPCAFSTLILLFTSLSAGGKRKKDLKLMGSMYIISVFATYFAVGIGMFSLLKIFSGFSLLSEILEYILIFVLLLLSVLSLYDFFMIKSGNSGNILLQLSSSSKKRIRSSIHKYFLLSTSILSSLVLGFLVSVFELGCTGQIYLPTITYIIKTQKSAKGFFLLFLYNIGFILPLLAIFTATYKGITAKPLILFFNRNFAHLKLLLSIIFFLFFIFIIIN